MFIERDAMVKQEQYRDMQREADRARLARPARGGWPAFRAGLALLSLIGGLIGLLRLNHARGRSIDELAQYKSLPLGKEGQR